MSICSTEDIRKKEIINLCDGARLGCATDFEINLCDAKIVALVIASSGWLGFWKNEKTVIPWEKIECIGEDTILVRMESISCEKATNSKRKC